MDKEDSSIITKVLTGHNNLKKHLHRIDMAVDPYCEFCDETNEEETAIHILNDCIAFTNTRQETFGHHKLDLHTLLENTKTSTVLDKIVKYFKKIKVFSTNRTFEKISPNRK